MEILKAQFSMHPCVRHCPGILVYLISFYFINKSTSTQIDVSFVLSAPGHQLTKYVISEHKASSVTECAQYCLRKSPSCKSVNYKSRQNQDSSKDCQLNNATKFLQPQGFMVNDGYNYFEPLLTKEKQKSSESSLMKCSVKSSCDVLYKSGHITTGVYTIDPDGQGAFHVRCDMTTTPGRGWTILQRRVDGSEDFYRNWTDYKNGFGKLTGEFWLGLHKIHRLTASGENVLRVDLESFENEKRYATFGAFSIGNENDGYILSIGQYTGNAGDSLSYHNGMKFSTRDSDKTNEQCAQRFKGAWWYKTCHNSNLNGQYLAGPHNSYADGVIWYHYKGHYYSLKTSEMKVG